MSIYIIYDYFFPAYKAGGPIQSLLNLVNHLNNNMEARVICSNVDHDGTPLHVPMETWTIISGKKIFYTGKRFKGIYNAIVEPTSVLYINGIYSLHFSFLPALLLKGRKIISVRGMLHPGGLSQKSLKKKIYLFAWKILRLHRNCEYHATSDEEREHIKKIFGRKTKIFVAPNLPNALPLQKLPPKKKGYLVLCTVALISPMKNHLLVLQALKQCPMNVIYHIYGPIKDIEYWNICKAVIATLPDNIIVNNHGELPPVMISEVMAKAHVFIQPSKSENFGHSIYEALTAGLPVITSHHTPWNNLAVHKAGYNVSINDSNGILDAINYFVNMQQDEFDKWSFSARNFALNALDIEDIKSKYLSMFANDKKPAYTNKGGKRFLIPLTA